LTVHSLLLDSCDSDHGDELNIEFLDWEQLVTHLLNDDDEENVHQKVDPVLLVENRVPKQKKSHTEQNRVQDVDAVE
jgi:hypothetical protein